MKKNMGTPDRLIRIAIGITLLVLVFVGPQFKLGYIGLIPLMTGLIGYCPIYPIFGISTCSKKN